MIVEKSKKIDELNNKIDSNKNIPSDEVNINKMKESSTLVLNNIVIISRSEDNFINATQLCKAGNKKFNDWYRLDTTKELIKELEINEERIISSQKAKTGIPVLENSKNCETGIPVSQNPDMGIPISGNPINYNIEIDELQNDNILISTSNDKNSDMGIHILQNSKFVKINKGNSSKFTQGTWIYPRPSDPTSPMDFPQICPPD